MPVTTLFAGQGWLLQQEQAADSFSEGGSEGGGPVPCVLCSGLWHSWPIKGNRALGVLQTFNPVQMSAGESGHVSRELQIPQGSDSLGFGLALFAGFESRE